MFRASLDAVAGEIEQAEEAVLDADTRLRHRVAVVGRRLKPEPRGGLMIAAAGVSVGFLAWRLARGARRAPAARPVRARRARGGLPMPPKLIAAALAPVLGPRGATLLTTLLAPLASGGAVRDAASPATAVQVDLDRFAGDWHEVAWLPDRHERTQVGRVDTTFVPADGPGGEFRVFNRRRADGLDQQAMGVVRVADDGANAHLRVSYAPPWLRWLPFAWDDQWVLDVDPGYRWALLGSPQRDRLWLLSRDRRLDGGVFEELVMRAAARGYPVERLQRRPT